KRLIGTRCSGRPSNDNVGADAAGAAALATPAWARLASSLVIRPPRPVPVTLSTSIPFSVKILAAAGEAALTDAEASVLAAAGAASTAGAASSAGAAVTVAVAALS